jgi:nucleoside-diphosphate-sugar epimerase
MSGAGPGAIAVTGASGFVGRHLVEAAVAAGHEVAGFARSERAAGIVREAGGRALPLAEEPAALARGLEGCGALVHLAQIGSERDGQSFEAVNVGLTARVLEAARLAGVGRVVSFSGLGVARYGQSRRVTSRYFLSKLKAELLVLDSGLDAAVFRPSYVVGPGDGFVPAVLRAMREGELERPGDGGYRMQPVAVADAAAAVLAALARPAGGFPRIFDLVGPEALSYSRLLERLVVVARQSGRDVRLRVREVAVAEAEQRARGEGGFQGMGPDELDCLLCDEVADPAPLAALLGRGLTPLDEALAAAVRAARAPA